jgi:glyoxylase-like metal-dependent hydrolase (beta-lactamase superfamily II)
VIQLTEQVHYLAGGVNSGLVRSASGVIVIDAGLDRGAANRIIRAAEELGRAPVAIVNTHAHADHYGGNAQLVRRLGIPVYAPAAEAAVIREPRYEPVYLFGGAAPVRALENRFLMAEPSPVDHVFAPGDRLEIDGIALETIDLGGHSLAQAGVTADGVLFAADAFFGLEPLRKHGVPYLVDAGRTRTSLQWLQRSAFGWYVPGHGEALTDPAETLAANLDTIDQAEAWIVERLAQRPTTADELLPALAERFGLRIADATGFVLYRTTLLGYLSSLEREGRVGFVIEGGRWVWSA